MAQFPEPFRPMVKHEASAKALTVTVIEQALRSLKILITCYRQKAVEYFYSAHSYHNVKIQF